jgi:hypothetical protein
MARYIEHVGHTKEIYVYVELYQRNVCYIMLGVSYQSNIPVQLAIENNKSNIAFYWLKVATDTIYLG